jgi:Protein of unknown function (DUF3455)
MSPKWPTSARWPVSPRWLAVAALAVAGAAAGAVAPSVPALAAIAPASTAAAPGQSGVPAALRVPAGNHLVASLHVIQGAQVYTCTNGAWSFTEPDADMGVTNRPTVVYTAGPEWISAVDGSAVWGMPLASANRTGTIPELLVKAIKNRGQGLFGQVDYIQRLDTLGGLAPAGSCTNGSVTASQYFATEDFWAPGPAAS